MARIDPLRNFRYRLEVDGITLAGFNEVAVGGTTIDAGRKLTGLIKHGNVTLKRGVAAGGPALELSRWHKEASAARIRERGKKVVVVVQDEAGRDVARFAITGARPVKYDAVDLSATGTDVTIELLELANEGINPAS